jgi:hypothetical protein
LIQIGARLQAPDGGWINGSFTKVSPGQGIFREPIGLWRIQPVSSIL